MRNVNPQFPIYIISKGRADTRLTVFSLERMKTPYRIVVEEQEFNDYAEVIAPANILVLDKAYQREYDTFDKLGDSKGKGPGPARNFVWDHSVAEGHAWHWVMDDNIREFFRLNRNLRIPMATGAIFQAMEDFVLRYTNIGMAGPQYFSFAPRKTKLKPFVLNTRIYSCNLIRNDTPFRWRGRYNEDTDLSLRMLKAKWVTVLFNAFLQDKMTTQYIKGGNTAEFYEKEGTLPKSRMQVAMHPDVSRLMMRWGRIHHHVDYRSFKKIKLRKKTTTEIEGPKVDNYGMVLKHVGYRKRRKGKPAA